MSEGRSASPFPMVKRANSLNETENAGKLRRISYITHKPPSPPPSRKQAPEGRLRRISYITSTDFHSPPEHRESDKGLRRLSLAPFSFGVQGLSTEASEIKRIRRISHVSHHSLSPPIPPQQLPLNDVDLNQRRPSLPSHTLTSPPHSSPLSHSALTAPALLDSEHEMGPSLPPSNKHNRSKTYGGDLAAATRQILFDYEERIALLEAQNTRMSVELEATRDARSDERQDRGHERHSLLPEEQLTYPSTALDAHRDHQSELLYERKLRLEIVESLKKLRIQNNSLTRSLADYKDRCTSITGVLGSEREERRAMEDEFKRLAQANFTLLEHNKLLVARDSALQEDISTLITKSQADEWMRSVLEAELRKTRQNMSPSTVDIPLSLEEVQGQTSALPSPRPSPSPQTIGMTFEHQGHLRSQLMAARDQLHVTKRCLEESEKRCNELTKRMTVLQRNMPQSVDSFSQALEVERELRVEVADQIAELAKEKGILQEQVQNLRMDIQKLQAVKEEAKENHITIGLEIPTKGSERLSRRRSGLFNASKRDSRIFKVTDRQMRRLSRQRNKYVIASKSMESPATTTNMKHSDVAVSKRSDYVPETPESSSSTLVYSPPPSVTSVDLWTPAHSVTHSLVPIPGSEDASIKTGSSYHSKNKNASIFLISNINKGSKASASLQTTLKTDFTLSLSPQKVARAAAGSEPVITPDPTAVLSLKDRKRASAILNFFAQAYMGSGLDV